MVDPLSADISLEPLYDLFRNEAVIKVFHAARQDLEIFFIDAGVIPKPLFDTQVAAMVCGFGDQVGYETLVRKVAKQSLDKSSRFTDWSRRPLTDAQKTYALADVTHLRVIYEKLAAKLAKNKRAHWVEEELQTLTNPETYITRPEEAWKRVKTRTNSARMLGIVRALAEFREAHAQSNNIPRNRVFKDDALIELASTKPQSFDDLQRSRLLLREARKGDIAKGILTSVASAMALPPEHLPKVHKKEDSPDSNPALSEMLRVLLKAKTEHLGLRQNLSPRPLIWMPWPRASGILTCCAVGGPRCSGMRQSACVRAKSALSLRDALSQPLNFPSDQGRIDRLFVSPIITILRMPSSVPVDRNLPAVS